MSVTISAANGGRSSIASDRSSSDGESEQLGIASGTKRTACIKAEINKALAAVFRSRPLSDISKAAFPPTRAGMASHIMHAVQQRAKAHANLSGCKSTVIGFRLA
ncbi:hypothetical protein SZ64_00335 [Erythrobacter sp. SG61-1L]|nr:hypothetical protein SZ64_00335 [Erythrobacter sp. SG61-1L]